MRIFVTGTDTNIGKTLIASWICLHTRATYWKPIQSGFLDGTDTRTVKDLANVTVHPEAYLLKEPRSPHMAAAMAGVTIEPDQMTIPTEKNLVIEGAGGVLVPINSGMFMIDLMQRWQIPVIVVARSTLGTINHTCLTLEALIRRQIPVVGVVLNGPSNTGNRQAIETYAGVPVLAEFLPLDHVSADTLAAIPLPSPLKTALDQLP